MHGFIMVILALTTVLGPVAQYRIAELKQLDVREI